MRVTINQSRIEQRGKFFGCLVGTMEGKTLRQDPKVFDKGCFISGQFIVKAVCESWTTPERQNVYRYHAQVNDKTILHVG